MLGVSDVVLVKESVLAWNRKVSCSVLPLPPCGLIPRTMISLSLVFVPPESVWRG